MGEIKKFPKPKTGREPKESEPTSIDFLFDDGRDQVSEASPFRDMLEEQKARFEKKFKRELRPGDPLFFDPDLDVPALIPRDKLPAETAATFEQATVHAAMVYAQFKVGFYLSPMNYPVATDEQQEAWEGAIKEFAYLKGI